MNSDPAQARQALSAWRPGLPVEADPEIRAALDLARTDPELGRWQAEQETFHAGMTRAVRQSPVPPDLAARILAARKTARPRFAFPTHPDMWALAAAAAVLIALAAFRTFGPASTESTAPFDTFRARMVRTVLREYRMDIVTNDLATVRSFLTRNQSPADFQLPPRLAALPTLGGGLLQWQGRGVSMVCLDGGNLGTLFLFIAPADSMSSGLPTAPVPAEISRLATLAWSDSGRTFVLAAHAPAEALRQLL
jgi:hypothetical protein